MKIYPYSHSSIEFLFTQTPRDFVVQEIPLYDPSGEGEHLMLQVRKKGLSTSEMLKILSSHLGISTKEIGYAGLKDKSALTTQYISIPKSAQAKLDNLEENNIKILSSTLHNNKIRIGHLKGNRFFIRLKKVAKNDIHKISQVLEKIKTYGMPNYFGYQRFGKFGNNYLEGKALLEGKKRIRDKKLATFLISSYQSHLFNTWLSRRIALSKLVDDFSQKELKEALKLSMLPEIQDYEHLYSQPHPFKLLKGELMHHYPFGKLFLLENKDNEAQRFLQKDIVPCGVLCGKKIALPTDDALKYQIAFMDNLVKEIGSHRFCWVFPQELEYRYIEEKAHLELSFYLPKGSYATVLLEVLANKEIKGACDV